MSVSKKEMQAQLAAKKQREENEALLAAKLAEEAAKKKRQQDDAAIFSPSPKQSGKGWEAVVDAYKKKYEKEPNEKGELVFKSHEEAIDFFKTQAAAGHKFCGVEIIGGKPADSYVFSCGDGTLYHGSAAEVQEQLAKAIKANPNNQDAVDGLGSFKAMVASLAPNPAASMREKMQDQRPPAATENPQDQAAPITPTKPTPK